MIPVASASLPPRRHHHCHCHAATTTATRAPPQAELVAKIAELVEAKTITGVSDVRDESDRQGLRVVVEVRAALRLVLSWAHLGHDAHWSWVVVIKANWQRVGH